MKILIAYASAGTGHHKAAEAVYNFFRGENNPNITLKLVDVLRYSRPLFRYSYIYGYNFFVRYALWLWSWGFWITSLKSLSPIINGCRFAINRLNTRGFAQLLTNENPDFFISTHFLASEIASYLKKTQKLNSKLITLITDYGVHPFWINRNTDIYAVASDYTKEQLASSGVKKEMIKVLGIPVDASFLKQYEKDTLIKQLGIEQDRFTVLIVTGSFGIGPIEKIVELLYKDTQLLVVCARNKRLYKLLKDKNYPGTTVFGFVENMPQLMAVADLIIAKPGGLTVSEILARGLVPIFISCIPGQETENLKALQRYGIATMAENPDQLRDIVLDYKRNPDKLKKIKENICKIKNPSAAQELYNVICQGGIGNTG